MISTAQKPALVELIHKIIHLRENGTEITLLAVCPNSEAVLEAAIKVASKANLPMLFPATLNQVDRDGGYTGWTAEAFVRRMEYFAKVHQCDSALFPCLDHGGPWLKDVHVIQGLNLEESMAAVKASLTACLEAGYALLHIDPTVDRTVPPGEPPDIDVVVARTLDLIEYAESERVRLGLPPVGYEVGTEEVHGGLADLSNFNRFLEGLKTGLEEKQLDGAWPCFIVGKVGTDLHTTTFDGNTARTLYQKVVPYGSLIKGHYSDWVANPEDYPASGMGGANFGPEFTATELEILMELSDLEVSLSENNPSLEHSNFMQMLSEAVVRSGRWKKWLFADEVGLSFTEIAEDRRDWMIKTGARYIWTDEKVLESRKQLYQNVSTEIPDPHAYLVDRIAEDIERYAKAFNLLESNDILGFN